MAKKTDNQKRLAKCISSINGAIEAGTAEHERHTALFIGEIGKLQREIQEQTAKRNEAANSGNIESFREAAKKIVAAESEKTQYEESLAAIQGKPVVTMQQAEDFLGELAEIQEAINRDASEEILELVAQINQADKEAMGMMDDLILIAQGLAEQASGVIKQGATELSCGRARVATIIGPTNNYTWRAIANTLKKWSK